MKIEETKNGIKVTAEDNRFLRRKSDHRIIEQSIVLGVTYVIGDNFIEEGHQEVPEDYEDVVQCNGIYFHDIKNYDELVTDIIRNKYSLNQELAISHNYMAYPEKYKEEWGEFEAWRETAKQTAKVYLGIDKPEEQTE